MLKPGMRLLNATEAQRKTIRAVAKDIGIDCNIGMVPHIIFTSDCWLEGCSCDPDKPHSSSLSDTILTFSEWIEAMYSDDKPEPKQVDLWGT